MSDNPPSNDYSLLSLILPKGTASPVVDAIGKAGASGIFEMTARGSILTDGGFLQRMFPPPSPEQHLLQTLVPNNKVDAVTEAAVDAGHLHQGGSGAVFVINCGEYSESDGFRGAERGGDSNGQGTSGAYSADLVQICCVCEIGGAEDITKAALQSGAPGPTITFGEGGGLRDKIPLLRMTKGPEKEFVWCVVEKAEADSIFTEMARAGRITEPGRGFMYTIPVEAGIIHVSSVVSTSSHLASMEQVVAAVDEIKGGKAWRSSTGADDNKGQALKTTFLKDLVGLYCIVPRDNYEDVYDAILEAGAPGVSTNFGVMLDADSSESEQSQNEEWSVVSAYLGGASVDKVRDATAKKIDAIGLDRSAFYTLPIPRALTYLG